MVSRSRFALLEHNAEEMRKASHVLRRANDRLRGERDEARSQVANWKALFDAERIRTEGLTEKLLQMKQAGFATATERVMGPPMPPSKIEEAIMEKAGTNGALRRHLSRWAAQRQALNTPEVEIVEQLVNWRDPDAEPDEAEGT